MDLSGKIGGRCGGMMPMKFTSGLQSDLESVLKGNDIVWFANERLLRILHYDETVGFYDVFDYPTIERAKGKQIPGSVIYWKRIGYYKDGATPMATFQATDNNAPLLYEVLTSDVHKDGFTISLSHLRLIFAVDLLDNSFFSKNQSNPTFLIDHEGFILYANTKACRLLRYKLLELTQLHLSDIDPNVEKKAYPFMFERLRKLKIASRQTMHKTKRGKKIHGTAHAHYLKHENHEFCVATFIPTTI